MNRIILTTLNARYIHSALGLRYLKANMGNLFDNTEIIEFTINQRPIDIVEQLIVKKPTIIGLSIYIWNAQESFEVIQLLKTIAPEITLIIGGPEVSYEIENQPVFPLVDYIIPGMADLAFAKLCEQVIDGHPPEPKIIQPAPFNMDELCLPYSEYTDDDIDYRVIYVEASRGCPFKCQFCLSALDKTVWPFDLDRFLQEMDKLHQRGVRHFKFVDRTFNLKVACSKTIMQFFLDRISNDLFLHFELIPDHLPQGLRVMIAKFPPHTLQFEIGVQTFNSEVQKQIERKQDAQKTAENLAWLKELGTVHTHADLIIGLPGEDMDSFASGLNKMVELAPDEIQIGILKRLRGTPIIAHTKTYQLQFSPLPPYDILATRDIDFVTMRRLSRFARYWDQIVNSGRFKQTVPHIFAQDPFKNFMTLSDWLYQTTQQTHRINLDRLFGLLHQWNNLTGLIDPIVFEKQLMDDFSRSGIKGLPQWIKDKPRQASSKTEGNRRQKRHSI